MRRPRTGRSGLLALVVPESATSYFAELAFPLVLLGGRAYERNGVVADHVLIDNLAATRDLTAHLIGLGRTRIAAIGVDGAQEALYSTPSLTALVPDREAIASLAVKCLAARIRSRPPLPFAVHVAPHWLEERESTTGGRRRAEVGGTRGSGEGKDGCPRWGASTFVRPLKSMIIAPRLAAMDIPRRLIELQRAVDAADNRYRDNSGENATVALAVWSDATAALVEGITAYAEEQGVPRQEVERALERAMRPRHLQED
ncbi:substrate-binding domain-containing protein [Streptomyces violaceorubidus]